MSDLTPPFPDKKSGLVALTACDYPMGRLLDESGVVDLILVGDSLGMVELGYEDTTQVTMEEMLHHTRAVARGVEKTFLAADLPIATYDTSGMAAENAGRLGEAGAQAVKMEGGVELTAKVEAIRRTGLHCIGHIGMLPQHIKEEGKYRIKGKTGDEAQRLRDDAMALQEAGACAVVLELVRPEVATSITESLSIPTIGIGSGPGCGGQILVTADLIGLFPWFRPKFVKVQADVAGEIRKAIAAFAEGVRKPV